MSVCKYCGFVGGWHYTWCTRPEDPPKTRIEYFGRLQVHQPARPEPATVHEVLRETEVACA